MNRKPGTLGKENRDNQEEKEEEEDGSPPPRHPFHYDETPVKVAKQLT
jgi:hypothetical protein